MQTLLPGTAGSRQELVPASGPAGATEPGVELAEAIIRSAPTTWRARREEAERARVRRAWFFRVGAVLVIFGFFVAFRFFRSIVWDSGVTPQGAVAKLVSYGSLFWAMPALPGSLALLGLLAYRGLPEEKHGSPATDPYPVACPNEVCFRVVSRGRNVDALRGTVASVRKALESRPLFPYRIEVVTDLPVSLDAGPDLRHLLVPDSYETPNGSRFKARALHYAIEVSDLPENGWIMHLDEESHVSTAAVVGIRDAIHQEEESGSHRIGQGLILYHRNLETHRFLTLADMIRTGEDLGRFHFQHRLGFTLFGLHGSFILVRNSVERAVGFDVGPEGSITEDAFWALRQMSMGRRCRWVEGYIVEQSPASIRDFVKQRRRWFSGLVRVVLYAETRLWIRLPLAISTSLWAVSWFAMVYTYINIFTGYTTNAVITFLGDFSFAMYSMSYVLGLFVNLRDRPRLPFRRQFGLYLLQVVLLPLFTMLEAAGVLYALLRPERGFHVIGKDVGATALQPCSGNR